MSAIDELRAIADVHGCDLYAVDHAGQVRVEARPRAGGPLSFRVVGYGTNAEQAAAAALPEARRKAAPGA